MHVGGSGLRVANLGDSAVAVVRGHDFVSKSEAGKQQHYFNAPFQLAVTPKTTGKKKQISDSMAMSDTYSHDVQEGDIVVLVTDGYIILSVSRLPRTVPPQC